MPSSTFSAFVRLARRGEVNASNLPATAPTIGPGSAPICSAADPNWGPTYDAANNTSGVGVNYGVWAGNPTLISLHNSASGSYGASTGEPVTENHIGFMQFSDPTSPIVALTAPFALGDPHYTSVIQVPGIMTPAGAPGAPSALTATLVAGSPSSTNNGNYWTPLSINVANAPLGGGWALLPGAAAPPCACGPSPCDTDQATVSSTYYGTNPDSQAPYVVMGGSAGAQWWILKGHVVDSSNNPLPAIPIGVYSPTNSFSAVEKVTNSTPGPTEGYFEILLNGYSNAQVLVNSQQFLPPASNAASHFYDPFYVSHSTITVPAPALSTLMNNPGDVVGTNTNVVDMGPIILNSNTSSNSQQGYGSISGQVTSEESGNGLSNVRVALRNSAGSIVAVTTTTSGNYTFTNVPQGYNYIVTPVSDTTWNPSPGLLRITNLPASGVSGENFVITGVPAMITVQSPSPGTVVLLTSNGYPVTTAPIITSAASSPLVYSGMTDGTNSITLSVPAGHTFGLTCWEPNSNGQYNRTGGTVASPDPGLGVTTGCPQ